MNATEFTTLLLFCAAMTFSPGPNTTLSTALAANLGLRRALRFCLAVPTGWSLILLASGLGLAALIARVPALRWAITLLGVAYMLWLAYRLSASARLAQADEARPGACRTLGVESENAPQRGQFLPDSPPHSGAMGQEAGKKWAAAAHSQPTIPKSDRLLGLGFWQGVALQFVNIKAWMLALTLSAGWVVNTAEQSAAIPAERLAIVSAVMLAFAFASNFTYALLGVLLRRWLAQGQRLLWFNRALALVLVATAVWMLRL